MDGYTLKELYELAKNANSFCIYDLLSRCYVHNQCDRDYIGAVAPATILDLLAYLDQIEKEAEKLAGYVASSCEIHEHTYAPRQYWRRRVREEVEQERQKEKDGKNA